jgi:GT2 family glycosyltransferase
MNRPRWNTQQRRLERQSDSQLPDDGRWHPSSALGSAEGIGCSRVCALIVNWNGEHVLGRCIRSLVESSHRPSEIVIVDNNSSDNSHRRIERDFPLVKVIESFQNLGFAGGNNKGTKYFLEHSDADFLFLLNNDAWVDPECLAELLGAATRFARAAVLAPKIYYAAEPQWIWSAGGCVDWWRGSARMFGHQRPDDGAYDSVAEIGFATGCAMLIRRRIIERIKLFDERYYMYDEDVDFSLRVRRTGAQILFVPQAKVYHQVQSGSVPGGRTRTASFTDVSCPAAKFILYHLSRNRLLTMQKHGTLPRTLRFVCWMIPFWILKSVQFVVHGQVAGVRAIVLGVIDGVCGRFQDQHNEWRGM